MTVPLTLVLGGARSGKSAFVEKLVAESGLNKIYIATGEARDDEMKDRIAMHRARRGSDWTTVEAPLDLADAIVAHASAAAIVLVDCLTLWISNLLMAERDLDTAFDDLAGRMGDIAGPVVLVSNEVGLGIVPENALARRFRDAQGQLNQRMAALADEVYFLAAGLPTTLKCATPLSEYDVDYNI
ncbi:MAG: bifunctional adenosylcobinamide kinase/adenosylcobinamide-phosphate guanylyltransferase [Hyphomicrobiaceae bacterium]